MATTLVPSGDLPVRTSHVVSGSQMDWPLGILEAKNCDCVALVQGSVEFLTLHQYVVQGKRSGQGCSSSHVVV